MLCTSFPVPIRPAILPFFPFFATAQKKGKGMVEDEDSGDDDSSDDDSSEEEAPPVKKDPKRSVPPPATTETRGRGGKEEKAGKGEKGGKGADRGAEDQEYRTVHLKTSKYLNIGLPLVKVCLSVGFGNEGGGCGPG